MKRRGARNRIVLGIGVAAFLGAAAGIAEAQDCSSFPDPSQCPALESALVEVDDAGTAGLQRALVEVDDRGTAGLVRTLVEVDDRGTTGLQMVLLEIDVRITNVAPIADATPESQDAVVGNSVTVFGGASSDPDMGPSPLSFSWSVVGQPGFSTVTPSTGNSSNFTFFFDRTGDYTIRLEVSDGASTATDDVVVRGFPAPPDLTGTPPTTCLDADSASFSGFAEPGSQVEVYRAGSPSIIIAMASAPLGSFTVDVPFLQDAQNALRFRATKIGRSSDTYSPPAAFNLTEDSTAPMVAFIVPQNGDVLPRKRFESPSSRITIDYTVTDVGCGVDSFSGTIDGTLPAPPGTIVNLFDLSLGSHTLTVDSRDLLGHPGSASATFTIVRCEDRPDICTNDPPVASAGRDRGCNDVRVGDQVTLDGSGSNDPDKYPSDLTYRWAQTAGDGVILDDRNAIQPRFTASVAPSCVNPLVFELVVSDGDLDRSDTVEILVGCQCGRSVGDPHFTLWNGRYFSFQGVGEYILATDDDGWTIQVRHTGYAGVASYTTAIATQVGSSRVTVDPSNVLRIDGVPTGIGPGGLHLPDGGRIESSASSLLITYPGGEILSIQNTGHRIFGLYVYHLTVLHPFPPDRPLRGLLSGEVLSPPLSFSQLYHDFGDSLRITQEESLFDYAPGESTETFTDLSFPERVITTAEFEPDVYNWAYDNCVAAGITDFYLLDACIFDLGVTGDVRFVEWAATLPTTLGTEPVRAFDADEDGIIDSEDNCMLTFNPEQANADGDNCGDGCDQIPTVGSNCSPYANAGLDQTVDEGSLVTLNAGFASDPDGNTLTYLWTAPEGITLSDPTSPNPTFAAPVVGPDGLTLEFQVVVSDGVSTSVPATVRITIFNVNDPPVCLAAQANPALLWPPNHTLVPVSIVGVTDPDPGDTPAITLTGITQDEPVNGLGEGNTSPDGVISLGALQLRSERSGRGNGRVYQVNFTADDGNGGTCTGSVTVCVPHDQKAPTCTDDGRSHDSTVSAR